MDTQLTGSHRTTYNAVFQHPVARNLKWVDVRSMLAALADSIHENGDVLKVIRHGKTLSLHRPKRSGMDDIAELMKVRHFLEQSAAAALEPAAGGKQLLVVIDHHEARVYAALEHGTTPRRIIPHDADGKARYLHRVDDDSNGQRKPELRSFYEAVATALAGAEAILLFGNGTGASSAMEHLSAQLRQRHPDLAGRVIASAVIDEAHLTEDQLLAKARHSFAEHLKAATPIS
jgi:hypothetical protein